MAGEDTGKLIIIVFCLVLISAGGIAAAQQSTWMKRYQDIKPKRERSPFDAVIKNTLNINAVANGYFALVAYTAILVKLAIKGVSN